MVRLIQIWPGCCCGRALVDVQAHFLRAGERDVARLGMLDHGVAEAAAAAGAEVDHAVRQPGFFQDLEELRGDRRRVARGLQDHGVAADDGSQRHAGHDGAGKIPRRNDRAHAERNVAQVVALARQLHRRSRPWPGAAPPGRRTRRSRSSRRCRRRPRPSSCPLRRPSTPSIRTCARAAGALHGTAGWCAPRPAVLPGFERLQRGLHRGLNFSRTRSLVNMPTTSDGLAGFSDGSSPPSLRGGRR